MVDLSALTAEAKPIVGPVARVYLKHTVPWFMWPVLYQVLTLQARDEAIIDIWCLPKGQAIRRLPTGTALRDEIERFYQAVWAYYPAEDSLERALSVIEHGVAFLQAARSWWDRYQP